MCHGRGDCWPGMDGRTIAICQVDALKRLLAATG
jgi:hypothetical protein